MSKAYLNSSVKAKQFSFDVALLEECVKSQVTIKGQFIRLGIPGDTKMRKPEKDEQIDLNHEDTHIFTTLKIAGQPIDLCIDLQVLNSNSSWIKTIENNGDSFSMPDNAVVSITKSETGATLTFSA